MSLPKTYRKLVVVEPGTNFVKATRIVECEMPALQPGEILVRNRFAGVNASDPVFTSGGYGHSELPFDVGIESGGEIVAVGSDVKHLKVGDHALVFGMGGGYAEYRKIDASMAIPVPEATAAATSVLIAGLTASVALEVSELKAGETILVTAAAGSVGSYAVQLAKQIGARVIGTCSSDEKAQWLRELGCDRPINYKKEDLDVVLTKEFPHGIDVVAENVGRQVFDTALKHLAVRGRLVSIGALAEYSGGLQWERVNQVRVYQQLLFKSALVRGFFLTHYMDRFGDHMQKLTQLIASGKIIAPIDPVEFRGIESIAGAVAHLAAGRNRGKILIRF